MGESTGQRRGGRIQEVAERLERTARDKIPEMRATTGRAIKKAPSYVFWRLVMGSLLHPCLPEVGEGGWYGLLSADYREDPGSPKGEDNHPEDGARGSSQLGETGKKDQGSIEISLAGTRFFTDSSAVLGMLRTESGKFNEFVGARVSEVKVNSNVEEEWRW
jgi:hypothetical protein